MSEQADIYHVGMMEQRRQNYAAFRRAIAHDRMNPDYSSFSIRGGGYILCYKERIPLDVELEAAKILADNGYNVVFTPENGEIWISRVDRKRNRKYADGLINGKRYEQRTIDSSVTNPVGKVKNVLNHALDKGAPIALAFDRYDMLSNSDIQNGINAFIDSSESKSQRLSEFIHINGSKKVRVYKIKSQ